MESLEEFLIAIGIVVLVIFALFFFVVFLALIIRLTFLLALCGAALYLYQSFRKGG